MSAHETTGQRVRMRVGWVRDAGDLKRDLSQLEGLLLAEVFAGQEWGVVLWNDREDPDCFKMAGLVIL